MRYMAALLVVALPTAFLTHWVPSTPKTFQGYWMGIDPVDGGDQRRGLVRRANGLFSLAGRDTHLTLCDHSDYGIATFDDGVLVSPRELVSDNMELTCFGNGQTVLLRARYELVNDTLMIETVTRQDGTPVHTMPLHKVSQ